jgi:hypothetical protein
MRGVDGMNEGMNDRMIGVMIEVMIEGVIEGMTANHILGEDRALASGVLSVGIEK